MMKSEAEDGASTSLVPCGPTTRSRHAAQLLISRQSVGPVTRARGAALSILISTQSVKETAAEKKLASRTKKIMQRALGISLIADMICSFVDTEEDLLSLRSVNRLFRSRATKKLRTMHKPINLVEPFSFAQFVSDMAPYKPEEPTGTLSQLFPFTSFVLSTKASARILEQFATIVGPHVRRYEFRDFCTLPYILFRRMELVIPRDPVEAGYVLSTLLSKSPQLMKIDVISRRPIYLTEREASRVPAALANLRDITVYFSFNRVPNDYSPKNVLLNQLLVSRATRLNSVRFPFSNADKLKDFQDNIELLRVLTEKHRNQLPRMVFDKSLKLGPSNVDFVQEMISSGLTFPDLSVCLSYRQFDDDWNLIPGNPDSFRNLFQTVSTWIGTQTNSLTALFLAINLLDAQEFTPTPVNLPPLLALRYLFIIFPAKQEYDLPPGSRFFSQLTTNNYPVLESLCLDSYREDFGLLGLGMTSLTSVRDLRLRRLAAPMTNPFWPDMFPNLTSLRIEVGCQDDTGETTVAYVLTHFPRVPNLHIDLLDGRGQHGHVPQLPDYWNVLTGNAPRPTNILDLFNDHFEVEVGDLAEPVDGVYPVSSLRNMTELKTLVFRPKSRSNLNAILYMTRAGLLGPLKKLSLIGLEFQRGERVMYRRRLARVHEQVQFSDEFVSTK